MGINNWPEGERPREKLLQHGASALSDAELLAIFLRTGVKGKSAVDLARELLTQFGSLTQLFAANRKEFCAVHGMGKAKFVQLQAAQEMARRALNEEMQSGDALNSPGAVRDFLQLLLRGRAQEVFMVIFLDAQHRVLASEELFHGTLTQTSVYPREATLAAIETIKLELAERIEFWVGTFFPARGRPWLYSPQVGNNHALCPRGFLYRAPRGQTMKPFTHPTKNLRFIGREGKPFHQQGVRRWVPRCCAATLPQSHRGKGCEGGKELSPIMETSIMPLHHVD